MRHAARVANATAGASVVAAGAIVVVAIAGLLATGMPFVGRMGVGSAIVVAAVAVGASRVLPVLMGAFAAPAAAEEARARRAVAAFAAGASAWSSARGASAGAGVLVLLVLASPFLGLRLGQPDDGNDAPSTTTRKAYDKLAEGFGPGFNGPLVLAASLPEGAGGKAALTRGPAGRRGTRPTSRPSARRAQRRRRRGHAQVIPKSSPQDERTSDLVERLRDETLPAATARQRAWRSTSAARPRSSRTSPARSPSRLPIFIALVVGLSVILLMAVFRSVWVPLVSAAFNLLSILAAYGVVVAVFQWGWGAGLLGVER